MTVTLRLEFQGTLLCLRPSLLTPVRSFAASAADWVQGIEYPYVADLLTTPSSPPPFSSAGHGTLYLLAPDGTTSDQFPALSKQLTRDCIIVDTITQVAGVPDQQTEQLAVDALNPTVLDNFESALKAIVKSVTTLFILGILGLVFFELWENGTIKRWWRKA